ncbi:unnamed protein product [Effrenium voratum]|nr:unnamed protein product [Effrenium voratum]
MFNAQRIERVPDDKYLFSELPHYPRCTIQALDVTSARFCLVALATLASCFVGGLSPARRVPHVQLAAGKDKDPFFSDPIEGTPYETNETTSALIFAVAGALFFILILVPSLQTYVQKLGEGPS